MAPPSQYHVFSLPSELLDTLIPRDIVNQAPSPPRSESPPPTLDRQINGTRACNICLGAAFADVDQQRLHFRSDWHRYNVKMRLSGSSPVSESQFTKLVDDLDDSISGSGSSSGDESEDSDAIAALVDKTRRLGRSPSPTSTTTSLPQTPLAWFHSAPSTQIGIYKVLFPPARSSSSYLDELKGMQTPHPEGRKWAMFMTAGGHFAGAIVRVSRAGGSEEQVELTKKGKPRKPVPDMEILEHKTFHRYTTRRKQGGSQSLNDNAKSKAVSAGATLRRYGEQALRDDIRNLLQDWAEEIEECERIFIRASVSNRRIFLDYEGAIIMKGDERLRTFPFPTRRPTQSELSRCLLELTRVKVSHLTEEALREQDEAYLASLPKPKPKPPTAPQPSQEPSKKDLTPRLSPEEVALREKWSRVLEIIHKGRLDTLKTFWSRDGTGLGGINTKVPDWTGEKGGTLLQVAAHAGQEEVTRWLLEDLRADPTIEVPSDRVGIIDDETIPEEDEEDVPAAPPVGSRRTAYDIARTRAVRNVFRRCAATHPDWYDWLESEKGARVPSVLTKEMEEGREEKKKVRRKGLKDRIKEREVKDKEREARTPSPVPESPKPKKAQAEPESGPRRLGGASGSGEGVAGLTPEMRARIERERRARAAEARLQAIGGKR